MSKSKNIDTGLFFNRELSWLEFNTRVMNEAFRSEYPILERFKFLSIASSNFDEFFMVRVAGVKRVLLKGGSYRCPSGISATALLEEISAKVHDLVGRQYGLLEEEILPLLKKNGIQLCSSNDLSAKDKNYVSELFQHEIFPVLTPLRAVSNKLTYNFGNLQLYAAFLLQDKSGEQNLSIVGIPSSLNRLCSLPSEEGVRRFILLEDVIKLCAQKLFPGYKITEKSSFRVTKDMDLAVDDDDDKDFLNAMREVLIHREKSFPVRLEVSREGSQIRQRLVDLLGLQESEVFDEGQILDLKSLFELCFIPGFNLLKQERWTPCQNRGLLGKKNIFTPTGKGK